MFALELCRAIGCDHPNNLKLTAEQFYDWWVAWCDAPWGETRDDLRVWAHAGLMCGVADLEPHWPYFPRDWTIEEIRQRTKEIEDALKESANGPGSKDIDRD